MPSRARRYIGSSVMSRSPRSTLPSVGRMPPAIMLKVVVLPAPFGPSSPTTCAGCTSRSTDVHHLALAVALRELEAGQRRHGVALSGSRGAEHQARAAAHGELLLAEREVDQVALEPVARPARATPPVAAHAVLEAQVLGALAARLAHALGERHPAAGDQPVGLLARPAGTPPRAAARAASSPSCDTSTSPSKGMRRPSASSEAIELRARARAPAAPSRSQRHGRQSRWPRRPRPSVVERGSNQTSVPPPTVTLRRARSKPIESPAKRSSPSRSEALPTQSRRCVRPVVDGALAARLATSLADHDAALGLEPRGLLRAVGIHRRETRRRAAAGRPGCTSTLRAEHEHAPPVAARWPRARPRGSRPARCRSKSPRLKGPPACASLGGAARPAPRPCAPRRCAASGSAALELRLAGQPGARSARRRSARATRAEQHPEREPTHAAITGSCSTLTLPSSLKRRSLTW